MRRTILLADDSPTIRRLVTQTFADADFKIVEVSNGDAAIKAVDEVKPNLVLTDIYMPGKNGYEVCTYVRNHPGFQTTPVILLVGAFDAFNEENARQAGATAHITKPFEPGALIEMVTSVLTQKGEPEPESKPETVAEEPASEKEEEQPIPVVSEPVAAPAASTVGAVYDRAGEPVKTAPSEDDLLGLGAIFQEEPVPVAGTISEDDVDRIADRVIQKLSTQVIESIAWDIVPDITEKIVREELKRIDED